MHLYTGIMNEKKTVIVKTLKSCVLVRSVRKQPKNTAENFIRPSLSRNYEVIIS